MKKLIELRVLSLVVIFLVANSCFALKKFAETPSGQFLPGTVQDILHETMDRNGNLPLAGVDYISPSTGQKVHMWISGRTIRNYSGITSEEINQLELMNVSDIVGSFKNSGADPMTGSIVTFGDYSFLPSGMQHIGIKKTGRVFFKGNCINYQTPLQPYNPPAPAFDPYVPPAPPKQEEYVPPAPVIAQTNTIIKETVYVYYKEPQQTMNRVYDQQPIQQCCPEVRPRNYTGLILLATAAAIVVPMLMQHRQTISTNQPVQWAGTMSNSGSYYDSGTGIMSNGGSGGYSTTTGGISNGGSSNGGGATSGQWTIVPRL